MVFGGSVGLWSQRRDIQLDWGGQARSKDSLQLPSALHVSFISSSNLEKPSESILVITKTVHIQRWNFSRELAHNYGGWQTLQAALSRQENQEAGR